jgi:sorbitol/mannitol transport system permease protein
LPAPHAARRSDKLSLGAAASASRRRRKTVKGRNVMATQQTATAGRLLVAPSVILLFLWMIVPLVMTIYFSSLHFILTDPDSRSFIGLQNYIDFLSDPDFLGALRNTLILVGSVLVISVVGGIFIALLMDQQIYGQSIVRLMVIAPFFVMPTVSALIWKNMLMNPVSGLFAWIAQSVGLTPIDWFTNAPMLSVILIVSWQWLPFASLILLTALQSLDEEQKEAAALDGVGAIPFFFYIVLPHIARAMTVVILIETIFLLSVFAEIYVTTNGGPSTTNIPFLVYELAQHSYDVGGASAGGIVAVVLANIVAYFLVRIVGKNLES